MMTVIIKELTAITKTNKVTNEQILPCARRHETQRSQKLLTEATKESKEFDSMKKGNQSAMHVIKPEQEEEKLGISCRTTHEP